MARNNMNGVANQDYRMSLLTEHGNNVSTVRACLIVIGSISRLSGRQEWARNTGQRNRSSCPNISNRSTTNYGIKSSRQ